MKGETEKNDTIFHIYNTALKTIENKSKMHFGNKTKIIKKEVHSVERSDYSMHSKNMIAGDGVEALNLKVVKEKWEIYWVTFEWMWKVQLPIDSRLYILDSIKLAAFCCSFILFGVKSNSSVCVCVCILCIK